MLGAAAAAVRVHASCWEGAYIVNLHAEVSTPDISISAAVAAAPGLIRGNLLPLLVLLLLLLSLAVDCVSTKCTR